MIGVLISTHNQNETDKKSSTKSFATCILFTCKQTKFYMFLEAEVHI